MNALALIMATSVSAAPVIGVHRNFGREGAMLCGSKAMTGRPSRRRASRVSSTRSGLVEVASTGPAQLRMIGAKKRIVFPLPMGPMTRHALSARDHSSMPFGRCEVPSE